MSPRRPCSTLPAFARSRRQPASRAGRRRPARTTPAAAAEQTPFGPLDLDPGDLHERCSRPSATRLPFAALLGTALALRPRRRGTPVRQPAVVQTQIVLAIVGALIMLVVGASLARAFGIVGAANLIRYRSKIDDPEGRRRHAAARWRSGSRRASACSGSRSSARSSSSLSLWIIEGFEPQTRVFELTVKLGEEDAELRPKIEAVLRRFKTEFELRGSAPEEVSYLVTAPREMRTDRVSSMLDRASRPNGKAE